MRRPKTYRAQARLKRISRPTYSGHKRAIIQELFGLDVRDTVPPQALKMINAAHYYRDVPGHLSDILDGIHAHLQDVNTYAGGEPIDNDDEPETASRRNGMNLNNAALLVRDDIRTGTVVFNDPNNNGGLNGSKRYTYLIHNSLTLEQGQPVVVHANDSLTVAWFVEYHEEPKIDPEGNDRLKWIVQAVDTNPIRVEAEKTRQIADKLKRQQAQNVREQILRQFGIESAQELLEG